MLRTRGPGQLAAACSGSPRRSSSDGLPVAACDERVSAEGIDATEVAAREVTAAVVATATSFVTADFVTGAAAKDDSSCAQVPASAIVGATSSPTSS